MSKFKVRDIEGEKRDRIGYIGKSRPAVIKKQKYLTDFSAANLIPERLFYDDQEPSTPEQLLLNSEREAVFKRAEELIMHALNNPEALLSQTRIYDYLRTPQGKKVSAANQEKYLDEKKEILTRNVEIFKLAMGLPQTKTSEERVYTKDEIKELYGWSGYAGYSEVTQIISNIKELIIDYLKANISASELAMLREVLPKSRRLLRNLASTTKSDLEI